MTEQETRLKYVNCAKSFFGAVRGDKMHEIIVDAYNSYKPHPRDHKLTTTDNWCAAFVSAIAILCDMTQLFPIECSCGEQIKIWKEWGRWQESDDYRPTVGELCYYDWQDGEDYATTDNTGAPDHVGIIIWQAGADLLVCEGNKGAAHSCGYRELNRNGRYIRGYGLPDFASVAVAEPVSHYNTGGGLCTIDLPVLQYGATGAAVRALQALLNAHGAKLAIDGSFGPATRAALRSYQKENGLTIDGSCGPQSWGSLIKG